MCVCDHVIFESLKMRTGSILVTYVLKMLIPRLKMPIMSGFTCSVFTFVIYSQPDIYIYIYIYIQRERETERDRERQRQTDRQTGRQAGRQAERVLLLTKVTS